MPLQIHEKDVENIVVLTLHGRLVMGEETAALQDTIAALRQRAAPGLIIDLKSVPSIDSTGLGVLVSAHSEWKKEERAVKLLHLSKRHIELLVLTKLTTVFEIFDDEQSAIDSFFPDRETRRFDILDFVKSQEK